MRGFTACAVAIVGLGACSPEGVKMPVEGAVLEPASICGSKTTADQLKKIIFDNARDMASGESKLAMSRVAELSSLTLERPVVDSIDEKTGKTTCSGLVRLQFPVGAVRSLGADGETTFEAAYSGQRAADDSGMVYTIVGANPIIEAIGYSDFEAWAAKYEAVSAKPTPPAADAAPSVTSSTAPPAAVAQAAAPARVRPSPPEARLESAAPEPVSANPYAGNDDSVCVRGDPNDRRTIEACNRRDLR